jgi:hypothetical protein
MSTLNAIDPKKFAAEVLYLTRDNLTFAARRCGLEDPEPSRRPQGLATPFADSLVQVTLLAQGHGKCSREMADMVTEVANMLWAVPQGEQHDTLEKVVEIAAAKIGLTPLL